LEQQQQEQQQLCFRSSELEMEEIRDKITIEEMYCAYQDCRHKKRGKYSTKKFESNALYNITKLVKEINERKYKISTSRCFIVKYPTKREVFCANFRDRVVQHFVYNEINPYMDKLFIFDTANCRKNKGTDFAIERVKTFVRRETNNYTEEAYYLKMDLSGFFMSIKRQELLDKALVFLNTKYQGNHKEVLTYLVTLIILNDCTKGAIRVTPIEDWDDLPQNKTLFGNENGLPIGNICSQLFANFYLNDLDHLLKHRHKSVSRYVDDIIVVDKSKKALEETLSIVKQYLPTINMKLNLKKTQINSVKYGIYYLGVKIYPYYAIVGKSRINRTYYAGRLFKTPEDAVHRMCCRWGMYKRYKGKKIVKRWYFTLSNNITKSIKYDSKKGFVLIDKEYEINKRRLHSIL